MRFNNLSEVWENSYKIIYEYSNSYMLEIDFFNPVHIAYFIYVTENTFDCFNKNRHVYFILQLIIFFIVNNFITYTLLLFTQKNKCHLEETLITFHIKIAF